MQVPALVIRKVFLDEIRKFVDCSSGLRPVKTSVIFVRPGKIFFFFILIIEYRANTPWSTMIFVMPPL
jgi:hypothetical protein